MISALAVFRLDCTDRGGWKIEANPVAERDVKITRGFGTPRRYPGITVKGRRMNKEYIYCAASLHLLSRNH